MSCNWPSQMIVFQSQASSSNIKANVQLLGDSDQTRLGKNPKASLQRWAFWQPARQNACQKGQDKSWDNPDDPNGVVWRWTPPKKKGMLRGTNAKQMCREKNISEISFNLSAQEHVKMEFQVDSSGCRLECFMASKYIKGDSQHAPENSQQRSAGYQARVLSLQGCWTLPIQRWFVLSKMMIAKC